MIKRMWLHLPVIPALEEGQEGYWEFKANYSGLGQVPGQLELHSETISKARNKISKQKTKHKKDLVVARKAFVIPRGSGLRIHSEPCFKKAVLGMWE